ncbi:MAG TPA: NADPH-dependent glutamate synthase [Thermoanaerobaculia bacterium]|nr:NADPH-dependent glutamate synthase [Thermoanaerobaculia bacterium]
MSDQKKTILTPEELSARIEGRASLTNKLRGQLPKIFWAEQDPSERVQNIREVPFAYTPAEARAEALRCLSCKNEPCVAGCPVGVDVPRFLRLVAEGDFRGAIRAIKETNLLPAICGRVCPQESQCQENCMVAKVHKDLGFAVSVGKIEAFLADWEREEAGVELPPVGAPSGKRVAIIGAGPSGLTCAGDLRRFGHEAVVFEAFHKAGGVLVYGIPEFRLPKDIVQAEVDNLAKMGVQFEFDTVVGQTLSVDDLFDEGFDAVYVATGAGLPYFVNVPGEDLNGVYSANEYLTRANLMGAYRFPEEDTPVLRRDNVAVLGGGNVAMDSARTALRLGAKNVYLVYRRSRIEMPARVEEVHHAEEEGVQFRMLCAPVEILSTPNGWVRGLKVQRCELGEPDEKGRRRPVPIEGAYEELAVEIVVEAIGNGPNPLIPKTTQGLKISRHGTLVVDEATMMTTRTGVFAGGDIVAGASTVILAMGHGRKAAAAIDAYLRNEAAEPAAAS